MKPLILALAASAALSASPTVAQDAERGARLYADTAAVTGAAVATCTNCHADVRTLRELIHNRGGRPDEAVAFTRWLGAVFAGSLPGAATAKAQYRNVLKPQDIRDLAAYIAQAKRAGIVSPTLAAARREQ